MLQTTASIAPFSAVDYYYYCTVVIFVAVAPEFCVCGVVTERIVVESRLSKKASRSQAE